VDQLARLLHAEDRRTYDPELFEAAFRSADQTVRRQAVLGAGRIQDHRAAAPLLALLAAPDTTIHEAAMFALGLLGDSTAAVRLIHRLGDALPLAAGAVLEAPSTLAKLGTGAARTLFSKLLDGTSGAVSAERRRLMLPGLLVEGWRFGRHAPVRASIAHLEDTSDAVRWRAAYLLGRTRAAVGTRALLARTSDPHPWVRQYAVRGLTRAAADSTGLAADTVSRALLAALRDADPGVRVNALVSLATWRDSAHAAVILPLLRDRVPNVRLQAVTALASGGGPQAQAALERLSDDTREPLVMRREAMVGLLSRDQDDAARRLVAWGRDPAASVRRLAVELVGGQRAIDVSPFLGLLDDDDPAVAAAAMMAFSGRSPAAEARIQALARQRLESPARELVAAAWSALARAAQVAEVPFLAVGFRTERDSPGGGASGTILNALQRIHDSGPAGREAVEALFLATTSPPADYLARRRAQSWLALAERWGAVWPAETRYSTEEYRELANRYLINAATARPRVRIATEGRGVVELELLGDQAPLTVANFLELVDRGFFDGGEWHRVIPNFVVQDGAGGPGAGRAGAPIRDEFNPVRYEGPVLGMALSGPDTGTSQWFINLSPQPHLDGGYTVFGRVVGGLAPLSLILQGDQLISIRR
jgi:cyclophilin family peptidyl-prolyl cis-trans isomerase/HEAT repeat protein